jgi:hypothetical protein
MPKPLKLTKKRKRELIERRREYQRAHYARKKLRALTPPAAEGPSSTKRQSGLKTPKQRTLTMRRSAMQYSYVGRLDLPKDLADDVRLLLLDPLTNRTRYGELRRISTMLWSNWVDAQRAHPRTPNKEILDA